MAAGPVFNFAMSIAIFAAFFWVNGIATDLPVVGKLTAIPGAVQELQPGDRITSVDGTATPDLKTFSDVIELLPQCNTVDINSLKLI